MYVRVAAIVVGLIAASAPAFAKPSDAQRGAAHTNRVAAERPQHSKAAKGVQKHDKDEAGAVAALEHDSSTVQADFPADVGWRLIEDPATGARMGLPEKFVPHAVATRTGSRWTSAQGQIQVETFRLTEAALPALFEQEKKTLRRQVASSLLKADSFVIAGVQGLKNFLIRADARGSELRGVTILYDQANGGRMERVGAAMVSAFTGFPDPKAGPPPGVRRMVEYGTAIVVSGDGDLIVPARLTDECQAITVPGFGHAERIAADNTNDLALIRLYGARNLAPATLAGDGGRSGDVTLFGVADPLAQAGGAEVSKAGARVSAQGVEPAPKPGFCGAAAADTSGALAGMVTLKPAIVAGNGSVSQGAALVPVDAIRSFLKGQGVQGGQAGQGVAPAVSTERSAMEQSVVRVICVRK